MVAAEPEIAALRASRTAGTGEPDVSTADWRTMLFNPLTDRVVTLVVSDTIDEKDRNWIRQLAVRIASCSAGFEPDALPPLEGSQGSLFGNVR
jgi:hypothetical protein